jgi:hypothetical protein
MKTRLLLWMFLAGSTLFGATACTNTTLDNYLARGFSCTIDQFTYKDFYFNVASSFGVTPIGASAINVLPTLTAGKQGDLLGLAFTSLGFSVGANQSVVYDIRYNVDPQPDIIIESDDQMITNTPVAPGFANVATSLCVGGQWVVRTAVFCDSPGVVKPLFIFHNGTVSGNQLFDFTTFPAVHSIGFDNLITLNGGLSGSSSITGFGNGIVAVPEPASFGLFLAGAALLLARRLRAKSR